MYQQEVKGRHLSTLAGIGVILLIVLSIMAAGFLEQLIMLTTGFKYGSFFVWALVIAEAVFVMRLSVREYRYTLADGRLIIESRYGDHVRMLYDIPVADVAAIGPQDDVFRQYGNGQTYDRVFTRGCAVAPSGMAYRRNDEIRLLSFQPDEKLIALIRQGMENAKEE